MIKETTMRGVSDLFIKGMGTHANGSPAEIVLADIDGIKGGIPGIAPSRKNVFFGDGAHGRSEYRR